ncbi:MAG: SDR family NAD(P)-dependent oxidoreductase [Clostridia bacterium]|nr:SDR family NAD(P)-dependent oxidoreductase [Clostridia bacterium]
MDRTVLITGASSGIGLEFAKLFAKNGYNLVFVARRKQHLERLASQLSGKYKIKVATIIKNLSSPSSPKEIFNDLKANSIHLGIQ